MKETEAKTYADFVLPPSVVTKLDLAQLLGELEQVDSAVTAARVRAKTGAAAQMPTLSPMLEGFLVQNRLQITGGTQSLELIKQLRLLKDKAPIIHMTFAVSADQESLQHITDWLRREVHPHALISVGLQPGLIAGVYMRTPNHVRDFSMKGLLASSHDLLVKELETLRGAK